MEHNHSKKNYIFRVLFVLTPLLIVAFCMAFIGITKRVCPIPGIQWNDEAAYRKLIQTCVTTGQPLGYWGFDGNHAILGTGSAWSPAILWPYAIFAFLFPVGQSFLFWVNLFYITLADFLFILLVKPDRRALIRGIIFQVTSSVFILYLNTNMSEIFRFAIAIILAGMMYRLFFLETPKWLKYAVMPLFILYSVQVYIFFAFCIPIYVFGLLKEKKLWIRLATSVGAMGLITGASYVLLHLISSNYNISKTEKLLEALKGGQLVTAVFSYARLLKDGLSGVFSLWQYIYAYPLYPYYVITCIVLVGVAIVLIVRSFMGRKREIADKAEEKSSDSTAKDSLCNGLIIAYSVILFFLMYLSLYTIVPDTFMRGTYIVVVFSLFLLMMVKDKWLVRGMIVCQAVGLLLMAPNGRDFTAERYENTAYSREWKALEEELKQAMPIKNSENPWENTVLMYTMEPRAVCAIPAGMGVNFVLTDGVYDSRPEYLLFSTRKKEERRPDWVEKDYDFYQMNYGENLTSDYRVVYEKNDLIIYQKNVIIY